MILVERKPVLGVFDQARQKFTCSNSEAIQRHEFWHPVALETTKALIRLHEQPGTSAPLLIAPAISRFSYDEDIVISAHGADIKMQPNLHVLKCDTLQQYLPLLFGILICSLCAIVLL